MLFAWFVVLVGTVLGAVLFLVGSHQSRPRKFFGVTLVVLGVAAATLIGIAAAEDVFLLMIARGTLVAAMSATGAALIITSGDYWLRGR